MTDTIELLEAIGRDASLRHASGENLAQALTGLQASQELKQAAASGDSGHLASELGLGAHQIAQEAPQIPTNGGYGGEEDEEADEHQSDRSTPD